MAKVRIHRLDKEVTLPTYSHLGDAGFDLRSAENKVIPPGEKAIIKTGIKIAIPENHVGLIWDRSGLAAKHEIKIMGGVLDTGYREELMIIIKNLSKNEFKINKNDRVAQMIIQPYLKAEIQETDELEETDRKGGLGHTSIK